MALPPPSQQSTQGLTQLLHPFPPLAEMGRIHCPMLFGQAAINRTTEAWLCPTEICRAATKLESHVLSAGTIEYSAISVLT